MVRSSLPTYTLYQQVLLDALNELEKRGRLVDGEYGRKLVVRHPTRITLASKYSYVRASKPVMVQMARAEVIGNVHIRKAAWRLIIYGN